MLVMARTFERLLRDQTRGPLCFVVVVPAWNDSEAFRVMSESCFKRLHFTLAKVRKISLHRVHSFIRLYAVG